jgi:UDP-N-acetylglucosamine 1-carboxyvinyltransferase
MSSLIIQGPTRLKGEVTPSGAKNAALKQIAACLLTDQEVILHNLPRVLDVENMLLLIEKLGCQVEWSESHTTKVTCQTLTSHKIDPILAGKMRASVVLVGPLLARLKKAVLPLSGGDKIGKRPIDTHLDGFRKLGVNSVGKNESLNPVHGGQKNRHYFDGSKIKAAEFFLSEMSVTATENLMMLTSLIPGQTILRGCAAEPEIEDLALMLNKMGAKISGAGTHTITIKGVDRLHGCEHTVIPDRIEVGTLACAITASRGKGIIKDVILEHIDNLLNKFEKMDVNFETKVLRQESGKTWIDLILKPSPNLKPIFIDTRPYPGFSTDLQAPMTLLLTQAKGESRVFETLFEGRLNYIKELNKMGAKIKILDKHNIIIRGPSRLRSAEIQIPDIRAGATLVLAGLIAHGKTVVKDIQILERGYERLECKLRSLGAKIDRSLDNQHPAARN